SIENDSALIGKSYRDLLMINQKNKKLIPLVNEFSQKVINDKSQKSLEMKLYKRNNEKFWLNFYSSLIEIDNKKYFHHIVQDITERKRSEEELKESEQKFRNISEKSLMGIIILQDFKIKYANGIFLDTIGYSEEEVLKWKRREFFKIIHPDDVDYLEEMIIKKYRSEIKVIENLKFRFISKNGRIYWVEALSNTINYKGKDADLTSLINITDRKEAEEKLKKSEKKYRSLLKTSTVGILEVDVKNEKITYVNPRLLNILGYTKKELNMEVIRGLLHPNDYERIYRDLEERDLEFRVFNKNGEIRWLSGKRVRQYNDDGNLVSVRLWLDDITERKKYERLITEVTIDFLNFTVDTQKNIQLLLNTSIKLLEGEIAIYIQKQDDDCFKVITSDNEIYNFDNVKDFGEELFFTELFNVKHDFPQKFLVIETEKYFETDPLIQNHNIKAAYGKLIKTENDFNEAICVFFDDIPDIAHEHQLILFLIADAIEIEHRRWEVKEYLEDQNRMLNEVNQLKTDLLTRTSHELKTPLISIKGFTELLSKLHKSKMDSDMVSIVDGIMDGAKRMEKIINTLIQASKLNQGLLKLNKTEEDLAFLIKFCIDEIKGLINLRDHEIELNLENNLKAKFDKERIYEVISNLLVNAVKYTPPGGKISVISKNENNSVITAVQDNGVGLTKGEKEQLFQQFGKIERYGQGYDLGIEGSGLGLYISKKIIQLHEGKIWAESDGRNKGSTFYFKLPLT
ncbi:MAG: PAS domain S-box protein, partial [Promethearchaeota archaeon]